MEKPLVSIVMPVKNTSAFLVECISSIINQTYTNWELLAVNDGSTDNSFELLTEFSKADNRIKVFNNNDSGIIAALRLAYTNSSGKLITRMDSDDIMHKDKLRVLSSNLLNVGIGNVALGLVHYFSKKGIGEGFKKYENWLNSLTIKGKNFEEIYKECVIPSPCWMVFREDLEKCNAFRPNRYPEDYDLTFRFYLNKLKPIACNKVLHYWRDYSNRTSRTDKHYADNSFLEIKSHYFLELEYNDNKNLVIWGAGTKGKKMAQKLIKQNIKFYWICDNPKKIGKYIYNQQLLAVEELPKIINSQSIITVANSIAQQEIKEYLSQRNLFPIKDYFFFC